MATLADQVGTVFSKLATEAAKSNDQKPVTVLRCWQSVLAVSKDVSLYDALAIIDNAVHRLHFQVKSLPESNGKARALSFIKGLLEWINPDLFPQPAHRFIAHISGDRLGAIEILADNLRNYGEEEVPTKGDVENISRELDELATSIQGSEIPASLKIILLRHASFMAWAIKNLDIIGVPGAYDALARLMIFVKQLPEDQSENEQAPQSLRMRFLSWGGRFASAMRFSAEVDKGAQALHHLAHDGQELVRHLGPLIGS